MSETKTLPTQACIIPFVVYVLGTSIAGQFDDYWYPLGYAIVATFTALSLVILLPVSLRRSFFVIHRRILWGIVFGIVGIAYWIALSHLHLEKWLTEGLPSWLQAPDRVSFNPLENLSNPVTKGMFLFVRLVGIAALVPIVEELFWRNFLLRWTIDPEWQQVPLGKFSWTSCLTVTVLFTLAHPEWFAAAGYCLLINGLLYWKKDLWLCIVAHSVSNFTLVLYVLATGHWWLW